MSYGSLFRVAILWLALAQCACGARTLGYTDDGGSGTCDPPCYEPWECDRDTGACVCAPDTCCEMVDCWCLPGEQHCEGNALTGCEERSVSEGGRCGSLCEYPLLQECSGECVEPEWGSAYCEGDDVCSLRPTTRYALVAWDNGERMSCESLGTPGVGGIATMRTGQIVESGEGGFNVIDGGGVELRVEHNLPWHVSNCLFPGRTVSVELAWYIDEDQSHCVQYLLVRNGDRPLLFAQDGGLTVPFEAGFEVRVHDLGCPGQPGPCGLPATYALDFEFADYPLDETETRVYQGESTDLDFGSWLYEAHNARSFFTGQCGADSAYAFYLTELCGDG
ncbi:MAG: hypothetical protein ABI333_10410 [bacterium]